MAIKRTEEGMATVAGRAAPALLSLGPGRTHDLDADDSLFAELRPARRRTGAWARLVRSSGLTLLVDVAALIGGILVEDHLDRATVAYLVLVPLWLALLGSYRPRVAPNVQTDLVPLLGAMSCPMLGLALAHSASVDQLLHDIPYATALVVVGRLASYSARRAVRARTTGAEPTLIVGSGILGQQVAQALLDHPGYGLQPVGFVDGFPDDGQLPLPLLGDIDDFDEVVRASGAVRVIVAYGANRETEILEVLRASVDAKVEVHILPRLFELGVTPSGPDADIVWGFPLQHARRAALRTPAWRTKRVLDVLVSGAVLLLASPVLAAAALAVRCSGPGGVLFRQERLGQRGEVVRIFKFRSMRPQGDADTRWGTVDDDRVTTVGRVLRATSIDELPQLLNVLRGDMSLVGPRPERPHFATQFERNIVRYSDRLRVPVGLTGWAQVHGLRGDTSIEERARFDNYYIEHWSLWFDLVILARTAGQVATETWRAVRPGARPVPPR